MKFNYAGYAIILSIALLTNEPSQASEVIEYKYDSMHRLIGVKYNSKTEVIKTYDALGNRLTQTVSKGPISNNPPAQPKYSSPKNAAKNLGNEKIKLVWSAKDRDKGDSLTFSIYFGKSENPPLYTSGLRSSSFTISQLEPSTTYYWKIKAKDSFGEETEGPLWSFSTANLPPTAVKNLFPKKDAQITFGNVYLDWQESVPKSTDSVTYSVYFGTAASPPLVASKLIDSEHHLGKLKPNTVYYWKISSTDSFGGITESPVWSFATFAKEPQQLSKRVLNQDTTLSKKNSPYTVSRNLIVKPGVTLTIEPGVLLKIEKGVKIEIQGKLIANGSEKEPIIFTSALDDSHGGDTNGDGNSTHPLPGDWQTIWISSGAEAEISHNQILYSGESKGGICAVNSTTVIVKNTLIKDSNSNGVRLISCEDSLIEKNTIINSNRNGIWISPSRQKKQTYTVKNNEITRSSDNGIYIENGKTLISGNEISHSSKYSLKLKEGKATIKGNLLKGPVYLPQKAIEEFSKNIIEADDNLISQIPPNLSDTSNTYNTFDFTDKKRILKVFGGTISKDTVWKNDMTYVLNSTIKVLGDDGDDKSTSLTIHPGVKVLFRNRSSMQVGDYNNSPARLIAEGTPLKPIVFTSIESIPKPGDWYGLEFFSSGEKSSKLYHCIIEYGGSTGRSGNVYTYYSSPQISHSIIRKSKDNGISINGGSPRISFSLIKDNVRSGLFIRKATPTIENNSIINNTKCGISKDNSPQIIEATNNWWGDPSGPLDKSDDTKKGGLHNPEGKGACVSDKVNYKPWAKSSEEALKNKE